MLVSKKIWLRLLAGALILVAGAAAIAGLWFRHYCRTPAPLLAETTVLIPKGAGVRRIGALLAEKRVLQNDVRYLVYLRLSGLGPRLQAGEYSFAPGLTPPQVLEKIVRGEVLRHPVTIVEGLKLEEIAAVFARGGWVDSAEFLRLARDPAFIRSLKLETASLEGYLFPDTYLMVRGMGEEELIRRMVRSFQRVWASLDSAVTDLSRHEVLTLASVVEKETGQAVERPLIARVFLNRLKLGMPLQSDPTVIYGMGERFSGNLRKSDLRAPSSHNTYVIPGLPPGPICSPGRAALEAVLKPASSDALYFVSRNDGSHVFSKTLAEHNRAVQLYQRGGKKPQTQTQTKAAPNPADQPPASAVPPPSSPAPASEQAGQGALQ
ncbi:MAG: endolytic transglycosylase MltG [bacterium]|nr:endolytic transglycosylase MltG [bacterium]